MKSISLTLLLLIIFVSFSGCSKKNDNTPNKNTLLTSSTWKFSTAGIDANNDGVMETTLPAGTLQSCDTDNTLLFKSDNTGIVDEGPTKCNQANPQSLQFGWTLINNGESINFTTAIFAGINGDAKLVELTSSKLTMSKLIPVPNAPIPVSVRVIVFLVH